MSDADCTPGREPRSVAASTLWQLRHGSLSTLCDQSRVHARNAADIRLLLQTEQLVRYRFTLCTSVHAWWWRHCFRTVNNASIQDDKLQQSAPDSEMWAPRFLAISTSTALAIAKLCKQKYGNSYRSTFCSNFLNMFCCLKITRTHQEMI